MVCSSAGCFVMSVGGVPVLCLIMNIINATHVPKQTAQQSYM